MKEFSTLIEYLFKIDQQLRKDVVWKVETVLEFNKTTTHLLSEAVSIYGIPTTDNVSQQTADKFVLLLSHCTDTEFIKKVIKSDEFKYSSYRRDNVAIALDNLLIKEGKKQFFGSALKIVENPDGATSSIPMPIEDEENVDKRRKDFGLIALGEYIKKSSEMLKKIKR